VEGRAVSAASIRCSVSAVDAATLKDGFQATSGTIRREFPVPVAAGDAPDVLVGAGASALTFLSLIKAAQRTVRPRLRGAHAAMVAGAAAGQAGPRRFAVLVAKPVDAPVRGDRARPGRRGAQRWKRALVASGSGPLGSSSVRWAARRPGCSSAGAAAATPLGPAVALDRDEAGAGPDRHPAG
jgi:hypothetical protein